MDPVTAKMLQAMQQHQTEQAEAMKAMATHLTLLSQTIATQVQHADCAIENRTHWLCH